MSAKSTPHRHQWVKFEESRDDLRACRSCGVEQTKIKGRWVDTGPEEPPAKSAAEKLADNDAKLRNGVKPESKPKPAAKKAPKPSGPSRETLEQAAKLRAEGATWNAIRSATGTKLGSSAWFRHWEREGIEHIPAGQRVKPKAEAKAEPVPAAKAKPAKKAPAPKTSGAAMKPDADAIDRGKASVERARAARATKPARKGTARTSNGKAAPVRTRKAAPAELAAAFAA